MKILFDYQCFNMQDYGGVSRYISELLNKFEEDKEMEWYLPIQYSNNKHLRQTGLIEQIQAVKPDMFDERIANLNFLGKNQITRIKRKFWPPADSKALESNKKLTIEKLKDGNFDIFHPTYYDAYFLEYIGSKPFVLTVYDLIHQVFPEFYMDVHIDKNKEIIQRADKILAISESTKRDLITIYGIEESKVEVTYLATSLAYDASSQSSTLTINLPEKYFLFVGVRGKYKNFFFFMQAFALVARNDKNLSVICTGPKLQQTELRYLIKLGIQDRVIHVSATDTELATLYKNAVAFVFPSMYEGFGIPVLEAFGCSCPIILSNCSSLSEIGGDAVIYFEPKNITSLKLALEDILSRQDLRETLIIKGHNQLNKFSWAKTARETKEIYKQILAARR